MEHLPPTGWGDVARRADIDALDTRIDQRAALLRLELQAMEHRLTAGFHRDMVKQTWILAGMIVTAIGSVAGLLR
jgi:hypothetical protein